MGEQESHSIIEWYGKLAGRYDELYNGEQASKHQRVAQILLGRKLELLVDVGCGTGSLLETVAPNCEQLLGCDVSAKMIQLAKTRNQNGKIDFLVAASPNLPLRDRVADGVVSISLIDCRPEIHSMEFSRVSRQNALIAYTVFDDGMTDNQRHEKIGRRERLCVIDRTGR